MPGGTGHAVGGGTPRGALPDACRLQLRDLSAGLTPDEASSVYRSCSVRADCPYPPYKPPVCAMNPSYLPRDLRCFSPGALRVIHELTSHKGTSNFGGTDLDPGLVCDGGDRGWEGGRDRRVGKECREERGGGGEGV